MTNDEIAIRVENLGKKYRLGLTHKGTIRDAVHGLARKVLGSRLQVLGKRQSSSPLASITCHLAPTSPQPSDNGNDTKEFWALKDVSFEVRRGEVLGIIGRGPGRQRKWDWLRSGGSVPVPIFATTLLKILSQVTKPTTGRAEIWGRVGSPLEVGTGFHPELTGSLEMTNDQGRMTKHARSPNHEDGWLFAPSSPLSALPREINRKFDEIVAFAGVERFIDTPGKRYSSGMHVRLGFVGAPNRR